MASVPLTKYGALIFDDPAIHEGGWICLENETPARVRGTIDVPDDRILYTNVDPVVIRADGLSARFRAADWGPVRMGEPRRSDAWDFKASVLSEMGLAELPAQERAQRLANLMGRWMHFAEAAFPGLKGAHTWGLARSLRILRGKDVIGEMPTMVMRAIELARTYGCAAERPPGAERMKRTGAMVPLRYDHAMSILSDPVPENGCKWKRIPKREIPDDSALIPEWVASRGPLLLQMVIERVSLNIAHRLLNPAGDTSSEVGRRMWRTGEEAVAFASLGDVRINDAYEACASYRPIDDVPAILRDIDPDVIRACPSISLFMTALHKSFMISDVDWRDAKLGYRTSPAEVFLRSRDMLLCAQHALRLEQAGVGVTWYGSSSISVSVPDDMQGARQTLFAAAQAVDGLITAAGTMPAHAAADFGRACAADQHHGMLRYAILQGNAETIDVLDRTMYENIMDQIRKKNGTEIPV